MAEAYISVAPPSACRLIIILTRRGFPIFSDAPPEDAARSVHPTEVTVVLCIKTMPENDPINGSKQIEAMATSNNLDGLLKTDTADLAGVDAA